MASEAKDLQVLFTVVAALEHRLPVMHL